MGGQGEYQGGVAGVSAEERVRADALSVSAAMALAKQSLESVVVRIIGEVSEVSVKPGYKAAYFTVKDSAASMPCIMWNNRYRAQGIDLAVGQLVELSGRFTLYAAKGRMNFDVFSLALAGEGDLRMKVANIAKKLQAEGLTDPARKRALPVFAERIGLVTSPRSAAVHDVLRTLRRRFPVAEILLAGVGVEGAHAPSDLIAGIDCVVRSGAQVVLVVRGGGSFEDLMPFNDEALARAIAACSVPVVTGIGHEVDTSIADMVSDFRASTPTAAAEAVSASREELNARLASQSSALCSSISHRIGQIQVHIGHIAAKPLFTDPMMLFASDAQWLDGASERLARSLPGYLERIGRETGELRGRMQVAGTRLGERFSYMVGARAGRLADLSPVNTLARGYSITRNSRGDILRRASGLPIGSAIEVTLSDGTLSCDVTAIREGTPFKVIGERG